MKNRTGVIHQLVHGYSNGHSLLSGSIELSTDAKRVTLIMSDMSGPNLELGFEEYVTGYPIVDSNLYALAKTWYAPEMERPGCVWTHTLLISFSDLSKISNPSAVLGLFHRPGRNSNNEVYNKDIELDQVDAPYDGEGTEVGRYYETLVKTIIWRLYSGSAPLLLKVGPSDIMENVFVSIWLQQWPRLRRRFSFCSGAIVPRSLGKDILDLQIVPYNFNSKRLLNSFEVVEGKDLEMETPAISEDWIVAIYDDLKIPSLLRDFLKDFSSDIKPKRESFEVLTRIYLRLIRQQNVDVHSSIKLLAESFRSSTEGATLKNAILSGGHGRKTYFPVFSEEDLLYALISTEYHVSFDYGKLGFKERLGNLYESQPAVVLDMLNQIINSSINRYGEEALMVLAEKISPSHLSKLTANQTNLLLVFITLNPSLTYNAEFWDANSANQRAILSSLLKVHRERGDVDWGSVVKILLHVKYSVDVQLLDDDRIDLPSILLDTLNRLERFELDWKWLGVLQRRPLIVLGWIMNQKTLTESVIRAIILALNPNSPALTQMGNRIWLEILKGKAKINSRGVRTNLHAFCLTVAFNVNDAQSLEVIEFCFETVYDSLKKEEVEHYFWRQLEPHTPSLSFWNDWDKCRKLLLALIEKFRRNRWPERRLSDVFQDKRNLEKALDYFNDY